MPDAKEVFRSDAKSLVDLLFESKIFKEDLTRDDMSAIENFIQSTLEIQFNSYLSGQKFLKTVEQFKMNKNK